MGPDEIGSGAPGPIMPAPSRFMKNPGEMAIVRIPKPTRAVHTASRTLIWIRFVISRICTSDRLFSNTQTGATPSTQGERVDSAAPGRSRKTAEAISRNRPVG
jgi:hypothetical protein